MRLRERSMVNTNAPFLHMAAGMFKPTRTGSFGESLGYGLEGFAKSRDSVDAQLAAEAQRNADFGYKSAVDEFGQARDIDKLALDAWKTENLLKKTQQALSKGTPTMQEYRWLNGADLPPNIPPEQREAELKRRKETWQFRMGTTQMKNAGAIAESPGVARLINLPLWLKAEAAAAKMHPVEAYGGQDVAVRNAAIQADALRIFNSVPMTGFTGTPTSPAPAVVAPAAPGQPAVPAVPAPPAAPAAPPQTGVPVVPGSTETEPQTLMDILTRGIAKPEARRFGTIKDPTEEKIREAEAKNASETYQKEVVPMGAAGLKMRQTMSTLRALDPSTGLIAPIVATVARWLDVLPESVKQESEIIRHGDRIGTADKLVRAMQNDILLLAKGVQTEGDAKRALAQIMTIDDPKKRWQMMMSYMGAISDAHIDKQMFYGKYLGRRGDYVGADTAWLERFGKTPLVRMVRSKDGSERIENYSSFMARARENGVSPQKAWEMWNGTTSRR